MGIVAHPGKPEAAAAVREAVRLVRRSGRAALLDAPTARLANVRGAALPDVASLARRVELLLVAGGDGTMLRVARELRGARPAVIGVNLGGLGFLTEVRSGDLPQVLREVWRGRFTLDRRAMLEAVVTSGGAESSPFPALNDFVISRSVVSRLIELDVKVNGEDLTTYRCDGLIISSPTGSTAYSLSAGGAVVSPEAEVIALTPVCPHTLSNRSVVVSLKSRIDVRIVSGRVETILSADGQNEAQLRAGDVVSIRRSARSVDLVRLQGTSFFETLRRKLHWRGSNVSPHR